MATQLSSKAYSIKSPNLGIVNNFFSKVRSVIAKLVPHKNKQVESYDTYLTIAENIRQRQHQDRLQSQMAAYNRY